MRLVYLGSSEESIYPLEYIIKNTANPIHEILAVVTQPAKLAGRGRQLEDPALAKFAKKSGILCLQPQKASEAEFQDTLRKLNPDLMITCAYGQILNDSFLQIPKRGTINIHPSLLPHYRGATPVQSALFDGLNETGISILFTVKELDAGNIIMQEPVPILPQETAGELMARLFNLSGPLLLKALEKLKDPHFVGIPQDSSQVTLCKKIKKEDGLINWNLSSAKIYNAFRAYNPWPASYTFLESKRVILSQIELAPHSQKLEPGTFFYQKEERALYVACGEGFLKIKELKPEASRILKADEFWNGLKNREHLKFS